MKLRTLIVLGSFIVIAACSKNKFSSTPSLTFKSASTTNVKQNQPVTFTLEFMDAEGDLGGTVGVKKTSSTCAGANFIDSLTFIIPSFPENTDAKGTIQVYFEYANLKPFPCNGVDTVETAVFQFWIKDKAGHVSDTASSPAITIHKP